MSDEKEANKRVREFVNFFESYKTKLLQAIRKDENFIIINFTDVTKFSPKLAEGLLDNPEDFIEFAKRGIYNCLELEEKKGLIPRFVNLPNTSAVRINNLRSKHLRKFSAVEGMVRQLTPVQPSAVKSRFECPSCGNVINIIESSNEIREPRQCGCGRKGKLRLLEREFQDMQGILLDEIFEELKAGEQPRKVKVIINKDLTAEENQFRILPGKKIKINGILKERSVPAKDGKILNKFDLYIEANSIESAEEKQEINLSEKDIKEIHKLGENPKIRDVLIDTFAPNVFSLREVKQGMIYSIIGGCINEEDKTRKDIHVLLAGEPGMAKSKLILEAKEWVPKARYTTGKGTSAAGLGAAVVKDELIGGWTLEAGAAVLANKGVLFVDEFDKMNDDDRGGFHEVMEQQTISINKANIQATLQAETTIIAACNPKHSKFNETEENFSKQLDMPSSLLNRFDLISKFVDVPNEENDRKLIKHMLNSMEEVKGELNKDIFKKYLYYARHNTNPSWTDKAKKLVENWYAKARSNYNANALPLNARQARTLFRLSESDAKLHLVEKIEISHVESAIEILEYSLKQLGCINEHGDISMDNLASDISNKERKVLKEIKEEHDTISIDELENILKIDKVELWKIIDKLKRLGDIFEVTPGTVKAI